MINVYGAATHHLNVRGQQRGITQEMINILVTYGSTHRHAGADITCFDKGSWKSVTKECPCSRQMLERLRKFYLVEIDGHPITVGHRCKRFKRDAH